MKYYGKTRCVIDSTVIPISKYYDCVYTLEDIANCSDKCMIDCNSTHNFEVFNGFVLFIQTPDSNGEYNMILGVNEDGLMFEGTGHTLNKLTEIPLDKGLLLLENYRQLVNQCHKFESKLLAHNLCKQFVNLEIK